MESRKNKTDIYCENNNSNLDSKNENISARLKRLRIQQNILQKGIKLLYTKLLEDNINLVSIKKNCIDDDNIYFCDLKKMFIKIKHLYEEIRFLTEETNNGKSSDIDEIRKNILLLETKLKEFKRHLQSELERLEKEEISLNDYPIINSKVIITCASSPNKLIAPSPVKVLIESPFKCPEVQQFQEFTKRTKRYGGWNEHDHNKFVQIWNTYYGNYTIIGSQGIDINSEMCLKFIYEVLDKIIGTNRDEIISHIEWYLQYLQLYMRQKTALNKWKDNRNKIKNYRKAKYHQNEMIKTTEHNIKVKICENSPTTSNCNNDSLCSDVSTTSENSYDTDNLKEGTKTIYKSKFMKPTKQWLYRCNDQNEIRDICNVETIKKLNIPSWRVGLH